jgi:hypothetical protein
MLWSELAHAVRAAAAILDEERVVVIGSQSILAWFDGPPEETTLSREVDIAALDDPDDRKSHILAGAIGEGSPFDATFGFHVDGVSLSTPVAPAGWLERCKEVSTPAMNGATGLFMEPHDLCVAKLLAGREKDIAFVAALLRAGLVDANTVTERLDATDVSGAARLRARSTLSGLSRPS